MLVVTVFVCVCVCARFSARWWGSLSHTLPPTNPLPLSLSGVPNFLLVTFIVLVDWFMMLMVSHTHTETFINSHHTHNFVCVCVINHIYIKNNTSHITFCSSLYKSLQQTLREKYEGYHCKSSLALLNSKRHTNMVDNTTLTKTPWSTQQTSSHTPTRITHHFPDIPKRNGQNIHSGIVTT